MRFQLVLMTTLAAFAMVMGAQANSSGAPASAANSGCTCHSPAPSDQASVALTGLPDAYEPGTDYGLSLAVDGPDALAVGQNQGGFMVVVDGGTLSAADDAANNVGGEATMLTHTASGNDQRSWDFTWAAPTGDGASNVTFWFAGNAVNGDTRNTDMDHWANGTMVVPPGTGGEGNGTMPEDEDDGGDSPGASVLGVLTVAAAVALWRRRE